MLSRNSSTATSLEARQELASADDAQISAAFSHSSGEAAVDAIEALAVPGREIVVHVILPNRGCIATLSPDSGVEIPAVVTAGTIRPVGPR